MIVVIPAYQPDEKLEKLVREIKAQTDYSVIVVNDGSAEDCLPLFAALEDCATVLHQYPNKGKGAAMKAAFAYAAEHFPEDEGIVTADA
ncbi:MAG: glycosyltransferase, partial [Clostridiales bacterium]|nr:glycosyltransferase [Clostridiales bacterium]